LKKLSGYIQFLNTSCTSATCIEWTVFAVRGFFR